jgi:hypothetical protein
MHSCSQNASGLVPVVDGSVPSDDCEAPGLLLQAKTRREKDAKYKGLMERAFYKLRSKRDFPRETRFAPRWRDARVARA